MDTPYLTEVFFVVSVIAFLVATSIILPTIMGKKWSDFFSKKKKEETLLKPEKEFKKNLRAVTVPLTQRR